MIIKGQATVVKHTGSHYLLSQLPEWNLFPAVLRGKIRLKGSTATNPVAVGDIVTFEADAESLADVSLENSAVITAVEPRRNYIIRKSTNLSRQSHIIASNLDRAFLVITLDFPQVKLPFLDRLLVTCEVYNVPAAIVLNKCDLYGPEHEEMRAAFHEIYEGAGYPVIEVSARTGEGVDVLRDMVSGRVLPDGSRNEDFDASRPVVSLFSGVSGVGKSSLIKALDPALEPRVGEISDAHDIKYAVDIYPHYGSDVEATLSAGYDIAHGLIGPGVYASHGYERSHRDGVENTLKLIRYEENLIFSSGCSRLCERICTVLLSGCCQCGHHASFKTGVSCKDRDSTASGERL